jgi:peroxiredoxin Q/BCP
VKPGPGDPAPDFTLAGTGPGNSDRPGYYSLSAERGHPVVLVFYPEDHSPVCTVQLVSYTRSLDQFGALGATVWGLSPQSLTAHNAFAADAEIGFPLLVDGDRSVAEAYETIGPLGFYRRCVFLVDADGTLRYANRLMLAQQFQPTQTLLDELAGISARS